MKSVEFDIQSFIDAIPFYVMLVDADHNILMTNDSIKKDLGIEDQDKIIGAYCPRVVHGLDEPYPGCPLEEALTSGTNVEREFYDPQTGQWVNSAIYATGFKTHQGKDIFLHFILDITKRKNAEEKIQESYDTQSLMNEILQLSLEEIPLEELLLKALDLILAMPWLAVEAKGAVFLTDEQTDTLRLSAQRNLHPETLNQCAEIYLGTCICGRAASTGVLQYVEKHDRLHELHCKDQTPHGHYCVPIKSGDKIFGVITLYLREGKTLDQRETDILLAVANSLSGVIQRKQMDSALRFREQELAIKSDNLEEMNTALRVLLKKREEDKAELGDNILSNVKSLVDIYLEKLKGSGLSKRQSAYVDVLQSNLDSIIAPFAHSLTLKNYRLTPLEIQVADLVRQGRTTKEAADILNLSARTIDFHRQNIRRKLGIMGQKANLRSILMSMQ